jgi:hypothetical protein
MKYFLIAALIPVCALAQTPPTLPLKDLGLIPTIKVYPKPEVKEQKAIVPAQAASAVTVTPATPIKK